VLTRPLDHENIDARIADRKQERQRIQSELDRAETAAQKLPAKQRRLEELETELTGLEDELAELGPASADDQSAHRERLNEQRTEREHLRKSVTRLERKVESLESDLARKRDRLADIDVPDDPDVDDDIEAKRDQLSRLERAVDTLQTLYNANRQVLERDQLELITDVERSLGGDTVACWVCGNEADRGDIEEQLATLSDAITERQERAESLREAVERLEARRDRFQDQRREKQHIESSVASLESRLDERRADLEETREELAAVEATIEDLKADLEATDQRRSDLEQEIARTEATAESVREEYEELRREADQRTQLASQIESITEKIESLRTRRERRIEDTRSGFEAALADIVDTLEPSFEAARLEKHVDPDTGRTQRLDLVVARDGREVAVAELSEGEVELVGFIAALAGYEAFDVASDVPCLLLDEVGGLASDNLGALVEYLQTRTRYLVTTAYPEVDGFDCRTVSPADWSVVSDTSEKNRK
jgi:DNA repair exonuclease SbcCD ATPase subunit